MIGSVCICEFIVRVYDSEDNIIAEFEHDNKLMAQQQVADFQYFGYNAVLLHAGRIKADLLRRNMNGEHKKTDNKRLDKYL